MSIKVLKILLQNSLYGTHSKVLQTPHYRCGKHSLELTKGTCKQLDMAQCLPRKKDEIVATWYSTKTTFLRLSEVGGLFQMRLQSERTGLPESACFLHSNLINRSAWGNEGGHISIHFVLPQELQEPSRVNNTDLTMRQRWLPRKRRWKIDERREFMLELKREDRARVKTDMVEFIVLPFSSLRIILK